MPAIMNEPKQQSGSLMTIGGADAPWSAGDGCARGRRWSHDPLPPGRSHFVRARLDLPMLRTSW